MTEIKDPHVTLLTIALGRTAMAITIGGTPPAGMVGDAYHTELTAAGGIPPYTWEPTAPLPGGLELASLPGGERAAIQGIPEKDGSDQYAIKVTDSGNDTTTYEVKLTINPKLAISTPAGLPSAVEGRRYVTALDATGGGPPYTWTISGAPDGLIWVPKTGSITWPRPTVGSARFAVQAADDAGHTEPGNFTITTRRARWWERLFHIGTWLAVLALGMPVLGGVWILIYALATPGSHWSYLGVGLAIALAAFVSGSLIGFLFGIPRVVSSGQLRQQSDPYSPSSNLAEVSDWLTKLLLGAGLVQLTRLAAPISHLIDNIAAGLTATTATGTSSAAKVMAGSILFGYTVIGLLDAYVVTTVWYQNKLEEIKSRAG
jgi:hypothetical protein